MEKELCRNCQICRSGRGIVIHKQKFIVEDYFPLPDQYDIVSCSQCGFVFADVDCSQERYDTYYKEYSKYEDEQIAAGSGSKEYDNKRLTDTAELIMGYVKNKKANILDIGSAGGGLLGVFKGNGYEHLYALEPSMGCVNRISRHYNEAITARVGSVFGDISEEFKGVKFDLIILSHVLEHVYDISKAMKNIKSVMGPEGVLYIEVPNVVKYVDFYKVPFHYFDVEHINHFDINSLNALGAVYGYECVMMDEKSIMVAEYEEYPAVYGLFKKSSAALDAVVSYVDRSAVGVDDISDLSSLIKSYEQVVVWGAGSYTKRMLANTELLKCNVLYFVDSDIKKQNIELAGKIVLSPYELYAFEGTIVIVSALYSEEIKNQIKEMRLKNKIVVLS